MKNRRVISALLALSIIMIANTTTDRGYDATTVPMVNTDLMMLTVSTFKQVNEKVQKPTHNRNCDK
jgi:hypothetical protein